MCIRDSYQTRQAQLQEFAVAYEERRLEIVARQSEVARVEAERGQAQTALAQAQGQLAQLRLRRDELSAETAPAGDEAPDEATIAARQEAVAAAQAESTRLLAARDDQSRARGAEIARLKELRRAARDAEGQLTRLRGELARQEERLAQIDRQAQSAIRLAPERVAGRLAALLRLSLIHI